MSAPELVVRIDRTTATVWAVASAVMPLLKVLGVLVGLDWLWVLAPLWGSAALVALVTLVLLPAGWSK